MRRELREARSRFEATQWTRVIEAGQRGDRQAIATLCQTYWQPVYGFIRARGFEAERARDLTQGVFAEVLSPRGLNTVRRNCGQFRNWLRSVAMYHACNVLDHERAITWGGKAVHVSIDVDVAEEELRLESTEMSRPDRLFDRCWARAVTSQALGRVRDEFARRGRARLFARFEAILSGDDDGVTDAELGEMLGWSALHVRVDRCRMKKEAVDMYRRYLRDEVGRTVPAAAVDDELRLLSQALA